MPPEQPEYGPRESACGDRAIREGILRDREIGAWLERFRIDDVSVASNPAGGRTISFEGYRRAKPRPVLRVPLPSGTETLSEILSGIRHLLQSAFSVPPDVRQWAPGAWNLTHHADGRTDEYLVHDAVAQAGRPTPLVYETHAFPALAQSGDADMRAMLSLRQKVRETVLGMSEQGSVEAYWWRRETPELHALRERGASDSVPPLNPRYVPGMVVRESLRRDADREFRGRVEIAHGVPAHGEPMRHTSFTIRTRYNGLPDTSPTGADLWGKLFGYLDKQLRKNSGDLLVGIQHEHEHPKQGADGRNTWNAYVFRSGPRAGCRGHAEDVPAAMVENRLRKELGARIDDRILRLVTWSHCRVDTSEEARDFALVWDASIGAFEEESVAELSAYLRQLLTKGNAEAVFLHVADIRQNTSGRQRCVDVHVSYLCSERG